MGGTARCVSWVHASSTTFSTRRSMPRAAARTRSRSTVHSARIRTRSRTSVVNITMLIMALVYPIQAAAFGLVWCVGRVLYIKGYADKGPDGRMLGAIVAHLGDLPLLVGSMIAGYTMLSSSV